VESTVEGNTPSAANGHIRARVRTCGLQRVPAGGGGVDLDSVAGLAVGVMLAVVGGLTVGDHHAWLAYQITARRLARAGRTPRALTAFLDDAHRLGLLRTVGPIYQFRHAELQDYLADPLVDDAPQLAR
jgi:hypothetical protein